VQYAIYKSSSLWTTLYVATVRFNSKTRCGPLIAFAALYTNPLEQFINILFKMMAFVREAVSSVKQREGIDIVVNALHSF
jgi:hypothetical protein